MKLIFGLGNPGLQYRSTRHNIGYMVVGSFAKARGVLIKKKGFYSLFGETRIGGSDIILANPQTFMNNSGRALKAAVDKYGPDARDILVVCDDINLALGIIRMRSGGSAGGHKGLASIIEGLGTDAFDRLRVGIGYERRGILRDYVLSQFGRGEKVPLRQNIEKAAEALEVWIEEGVEAAMNKFNTKNIEGTQGG